MFYCYHQNNLDGNFIIDDNVTVTVIIEAESDKDADSRASALGLAFDPFVDEWSIAPVRWESAKGYTPMPDPSPFVRGALHYDKEKVDVGEAFCYVYKASGEKVKFIREQ